METKKLKKLNIAVSCSVEMKDVEIPEEICNNLVGLYEMDITELKPNSNYDIENGVCSWLSENVRENDRSRLRYEIEELQTCNEEE